jgi:hypothetical protein
VYTTDVPAILLFVPNIAGVTILIVEAVAKLTGKVMAIVIVVASFPMMPTVLHEHPIVAVVSVRMIATMPNVSKGTTITSFL